MASPAGDEMQQPSATPTGQGHICEALDSSPACVHSRLPGHDATRRGPGAPKAWWAFAEIPAPRVQTMRRLNGTAGSEACVMGALLWTVDGRRWTVSCVDARTLRGGNPLALLFGSPPRAVYRDMVLPWCCWAVFLFHGLGPPGSPGRANGLLKVDCCHRIAEPAGEASLKIGTSNSHGARTWSLSRFLRLIPFVPPAFGLSPPFTPQGRHHHTLCRDCPLLCHATCVDAAAAA
ncbi:hypothetical protein BS50DRAFT_242459 [Corynespora cassiicola Philippines]|uniref:Uncharacterized protein n=1 Tax=Corynespora cassiicola Philippines TaxID=1448308 RepID=A0A2T2P304_CORCC|nr:hypothetical protein BS50DRAFT_242459 [Corynespora cassiicola Philippines]